MLDIIVDLGLFCTYKQLIVMQSTFKVTKEILMPGMKEIPIFDLNGRCAFAVCNQGDFDVRIMHNVYHVEDHCMVLGMPFVHIEVTEVRRPSEMIVGGVGLEEVLSIINRTVASSNLLAIGRHPMVKTDRKQFEYIKTSVEEYWRELADSEKNGRDNTCRTIHHEVIEARCRLIVGQVLKLYFSNIMMDVKAHNHHDMIFQHFMLDLYTYFRQERKVSFYAQRSCLSMKYFSTLVKDLSGASPSEWIETVVIGEAKILLRNPVRNIKEIVTLLNFPDAPTFTKYFMRVSGMTPRSFRQSVMHPS